MVDEDQINVGNIAIGTLEKLLNNPLLNRELEGFFYDNYIDELWTFRRLVTRWKIDCQDYSIDYKQLLDQAEDLYNKMIKPGAEMQINISSTLQESVETLIIQIKEKSNQEREELSKMFDEVMKEVSMMLLLNMNERISSLGVSTSSRNIESDCIEENSSTMDSNDDDHIKFKTQAGSDLCEEQLDKGSILQGSMLVLI